MLQLIITGLGGREIANRLYGGEATVKSHISRLVTTSGLRDRAQPVGYAYRHGPDG